MQLNKKTKKNSFSSMALMIMLNINILTYGVFGIMQLAQLIKVKIMSRRFGSKFVFDVPPDIKIWAFKDIIVNKLNLPRKESVKSLGISVEFIYKLYSESLLKDNITLREAGVKNDDILQRKIDISISDPMVQDLEKELSGMDRIVFAKPPEDWYERMDELRREIDKRKQKLYNQYSKKILEQEF